MKKSSLLILIVVSVYLLSVITGCGTAPSSQGSSIPQSEVGNAGAPSVGIVLSAGGRGDHSFNDSAILGLDRAVEELGITYKDITSKDPSEDAKLIEQMVGKYDLIVGVGFSFADAIEESAKEHPEQKFIIIEHTYEEHLPNVQEVVFREHEGAYLVGILGAGLSESGTISFIGPMDTAVIHGREGGYKAGARAYNPNINIITAYTGNDPSAFNNPTKCKEITLNTIAQGSDFIFSVAASSGIGSFDAAEEKGVRLVSADTNYSFLKPGIIIGGLEKHVDVALFDTIKDLQDGKFQSGIVSYGLANNGVELTGLRELTPAEELLSPEDREKVIAAKEAIPEELIQKIEQSKQDIIDGKIIVPDWMNDGKPAGE